MKIITRAEWEKIHPDYKRQDAGGVRRVLERDPATGATLSIPVAVADLRAGQRVTLLTIDEVMALTHRFELMVRQALEPTPQGYQGRKTRWATVTQRGKRTPRYLDLAADDILLDGWGLPFRTDGEAGGVFSGNACFNLVGDPEAIRRCIEGRAVLPVSDDAKAKVLVSRDTRTTCDDRGIALLYPDIRTHHAVVNRLKAGAPR
jgi:hypothetical protein